MDGEFARRRKSGRGFVIAARAGPADEKHNIRPGWGEGLGERRSAAADGDALRRDAAVSLNETAQHRSVAVHSAGLRPLWQQDPHTGTADHRHAQNAGASANPNLLWSEQRRCRYQKRPGCRHRALLIDIHTRRPRLYNDDMPGAVEFALVKRQNGIGLPA
jgi:hypothetical protein